MRIQVTDRSKFNITSREYTQEGFLLVPGHVARTGTQDYLASELELPGDPNRRVTIMRPPQEVFEKDSLESFQVADVTVEHPEDWVTPDTFKNVTVGVVKGSAVQDGDFVKCSLVIKDKEAIKAVESGKVQLSVGYSAVYDDDVPEGADYEFIQRDIKVNHIALVDAARAGPQAKLFDKKPEVKLMKLVTLDSGNAVEIEDGATATLVQDSIDRTKKARDEAVAESAKSKDELEKVRAEKDEAVEEKEEMEKKSSDSEIALRIKTVVDCQTSALLIAGKDFTCDSVVIADIQRAALTITRDSIDWAKKDDTYVQASFDMAVESKEAEDEDEDDENKGKKSNDSHVKLAKDAAGNVIVPASPLEHRDAATKTMQDGWKKTAGIGGDE